MLVDISIMFCRANLGASLLIHPVIYACMTIYRVVISRKPAWLFKVTCNRPDSPAHIDLDLEGFPYHTLLQEVNLPEYIKEQLCCEDSPNITYPIL
jgi:hypothetical protein